MYSLQLWRNSGNGLKQQRAYLGLLSWLLYAASLVRRTFESSIYMRQLEKKLEVQGEMALGLVELRKAYDTVLGEMVMVTLRWLGVPEAEVSLMDVMHKGTKGRVLVGPIMSEKFSVNIEVRKVSQPAHDYHGDVGG